jgi:hypothetical protein
MRKTTEYRKQVRKEIKKAMEFHKRLMKKLATPYYKNIVASSFMKIGLIAKKNAKRGI